MSKNNEEEEILTTVNVVMNYHTYKAFKKIVGAQNASKEIRAMIKERVLAEEQKNEKPQNHLSFFQTQNSTTNQRQNQNEVKLHV